MKKLFIGLTALIISANLFAQGIEFDHAKFSDALTKAKKENKLVFVDCYTAWCGPCKIMAKKVFTQEEAGNYFNKNFINLKIDMEKGEGVDIAKKYNVNAYPTLLFLDGNGIVLKRIIGAQSLESLLQHAKSVKSEKLAAFQKRYKQGERSNEFLIEYAKAYYQTYLQQRS